MLCPSIKNCSPAMPSRADTTTATYPNFHFLMNFAAAQAGTTQLAQVYVFFTWAYNFIA
jgi:hypothetical protein